MIFLFCFILGIVGGGFFSGFLYNFPFLFFFSFFLRFYISTSHGGIFSFCMAGPFNFSLLCFILLLFTIYSDLATSFLFHLSVYFATCRNQACGFRWHWQWASRLQKLASQHYIDETAQQALANWARPIHKSTLFKAHYYRFYFAIVVMDRMDALPGTAENRGLRVVTTNATLLRGRFLSSWAKDHPAHPKACS